MPSDQEQIAANIRAARAWADLSQTAIAEALGFRSTIVVKQLEGGLREASDDELDAIADACGVPLWFLHHGPQLAAADPSQQAQIAALEDGYRAQIAALQDAYRDITAKSADAIETLVRQAIEAAPKQARGRTGRDVPDARGSAVPPPPAANRRARRPRQRPQP